MWPPGHRPALRIRIGGQWQYCVVHMRLDYADGTVGYQVDVRQPDGTVIRTYRWDPEVMRIAHGSDVDPDDHRDPEDGRS
ncbi:hypothetical protein [Streptomyces mobaraensis]|uniref:Uncharacterized protein n=1 Tax=Streptomyces mobaraensis TaxID=35621 RepID=A0A5N5WCQ7_STRMB|nr:hypothetical protein [Streptomyces mobaraensis]KAB7850111.1 hypothetical protein FRZ00_05790 [Streptomyces mobaraensis]